MSAENPTPLTPEGKRAADRVRTIFYAIAAANIVLVAIVIWQRQAHKEHPEPPAKPVTTQEAERDHDRGEKHGFTDAPGK